MKSISIMLLTYNRRDFLERCMYYLCETANLEKNIEAIYIWDNASDDDTPDFLASYKQFDFIKPMRSKVNIGTACLDKMLPLIKTPYVMTLEPDAWICTKGWDEDAIKCFEARDNIGSVQLQYYNDDRSRFGVTWEGINYNKFTKPRFRCEELLVREDINQTSIGFNPQKDEMLNGIGVNRWSNFVICSGLTIWKTDSIKGHKWQSHSGLISDLNGEWGHYILRNGFQRVAMQKHKAYHCLVSPWFHLGREYKYWEKKAELAPIVYGRPSETEWLWYNQAKEWSGWGSGIPDSSKILEQGYY